MTHWNSLVRNSIAFLSERLENFSAGLDGFDGNETRDNQTILCFIMDQDESTVSHGLLKDILPESRLQLLQSTSTDSRVGMDVLRRILQLPQDKGFIIDIDKWLLSGTDPCARFLLQV